MITLKPLISTIACIALAFIVSAQDYNNIEFIENKGQWDDRVKFKGEVTGGSIFIRSTGFTILQHNRQDYAAVMAMLHQHDSKEAASLARADASVNVRSHAYNVDFVGASPQMQVVPDKMLPSHNNYITGSDPSRWGAECHIYQAITLKDVYPNVDVRYYTDNGTLKYDILAKPGSDISKIALRYEGADKLQVKNKELVIRTSVGELRESIPHTYQATFKERKEISCKYVVKDNIVRFDVGDYDRSSTLVIDPSPTFCSFAGSSGENWGFTATYGPDGSFFGGGIVFSSGFPVTTGAFQTSFGGGGSESVDIGIIKLSPNGSARIYATYIGGTGSEQPHSLIVDPQGNLILAGRTNSPIRGPGAYPITGDSIGRCGGYDIVVTKLNASGTGLIGSRRIGGTGDDGVNIKAGRGGVSSLEQNYGDDGRSEVILDGGGNVYIASSTQSNSTDPNLKFPVTPGAFQQNFGGGKQDGVVMKFTPNLAVNLFSSYLGGSGNDAAYVLSLGPTGDIYIGGGTELGNSATDFIGNHAGTVGPSHVGMIDGFIARVSNNGSSIISSAYIGTEQIDQIYGVQFDRKGFVYIMGQTRGVMAPINAEYSNPGSRQFIAKLQPDLSAYVYRTVFGNGSSIPNISPTAFLVDRCENVYVSGWGGPIGNGAYPSGGTAALPLTADAIPHSPDGRDFYFFVLRKDALGTTPLFASYFGQSGGFTDHVDGGTSRFDENGVIYQSICANCQGGAIFPTTPGSWARSKPAGASCNLAMVKIPFSLAGVGSDVRSAIGGVPSDTAGCVPLEVVFADQVRNAQEYIWNFGDGSGDLGPFPAATGYSQAHTFTAVGTYRVMLVAINPASCNVRDTSYINIRVGDLRANLAADYAKTGDCHSLTYIFNNLSTTDPSKPFTDTSFIWDFGDGSAPVIAGMNGVTHTFPAQGPYVVTLTLNDTSYCNNPETLTLNISIAANVEAIIETPPVGCAPYSVEFGNESMGGVTWQWNFGDPASGANNTSTAYEPTHVYATPGTYTVTLIATDPFTCNLVDTSTFTIEVYDKPTAVFSYTPVAPIINTPNVFSNQSSANADRFKWIWGDGDTLMTTSRADVEHQYNFTGRFTACLVAFNPAGCTDTVCQDVDVLIDPLLDVPNAFTPNSNDVNSVVKVRGFGISKLRFTIWNRWGQKVFETANHNEGWNGRVNGVIQPMDVYAYTVEAEFFDGKKTSKKGDITLIR